jgi:hypothetical protein
MMRWLKRKLRNWINTPSEVDMMAKEEMPVTKSMGQTLSGGLRFNAYKAEGGTIIEVFESSDMNRISNGRERGPKLYIITDQQDLGQEIAKIFTIETLGRN